MIITIIIMKTNKYDDSSTLLPQIRTPIIMKTTAAVEMLQHVILFPMTMTTIILTKRRRAIRKRIIV